jgi:hypothetical protein
LVVFVVFVAVVVCCLQGLGSLDRCQYLLRTQKESGWQFALMSALALVRRC